MLQNKLLFNQSSVSLEIIGLPDYSNSEKNDQISIISKWKLIIVDKPLIEGNFEHLSLIMDAFYSYSNFLINNETSIYESNLIDIKASNSFKHNLLLKSSKANVKPLSMNIGNSVLSDIINCFDQLNSSKKVRKMNLNIFKNIEKKANFNLTFKTKISNFLLLPFLSICSIFLVSSTFIYLYDFKENQDSNALINSKIKTNSIKTIKTIV